MMTKTPIQSRYFKLITIYPSSTPQPELRLALSGWNPEEDDLWPRLWTMFLGSMDLKEMVNRGTGKVNNVSALCLK